MAILVEDAPTADELAAAPRPRGRFSLGTLIPPGVAEELPYST